MRPLFLSWKTIVSVGAVWGLLLMVGPASNPTPALAGNSAAAAGLAGSAEAASTDPVAGENRAARQPLRPVGADLQQASGTQPLPDGLPAQAGLLHAGRA